MLESGVVKKRVWSEKATSPSLLDMPVAFVGLAAESLLSVSGLRVGVNAGVVLLAPPLVVLVMRAANDRNVMGEHVNGWWLDVLGWGTTIAMFAAAAGLVVTWGR